jgi:alpha-beta hydrolase superfamily lysophospholipase
VVVSDYLDPRQRVVATETAHRCGGAGWAMQNWGSVAGVSPNWLTRPAEGPLAARLVQNIPATSSAPLLVTQGDADQVITSQSSDAWVAWLCRAGQLVDYRTYPGLGHQSPARAEAPQFPAVQAWLADRFAGRAAQTTCGKSR